MLGMMTMSLAVLSLVAAVVAIGWLSILKKHLSVLGQRVLESEDIGRIIQAADKVGSYESRMVGCESKTGESKRQFAEHETKLSELIAGQRETKQRIDGHSADLAKVSEKTASFEHRFNEFESSVDEKLNRLLELEAKANELTARLESIEQIANRNEAGLAQVDRSIKALTDEIGILQKFQTATEKAHSLIQAAFTDMQTSMPSEEAQEITSEIAEPEEISQGPEDQYTEAEDQKPSETYNSSIEENIESWRYQ
jgi:chromosome segregation ATPase